MSCELSVECVVCSGWTQCDRLLPLSSTQRSFLLLAQSVPCFNLLIVLVSDTPLSFSLSSCLACCHHCLSSCC